MTVSIIIPCHNPNTALTHCLKSCFTQTHPQIEILLIDNNSTDSSIAIAQTLLTQSPFPYKILHCPQPGATHARTLGFTHAQGQYIQWLDADDTLAPNKINNQVAALETHPTDAIAYGDWTWQFHHANSTTTHLHFTSQPHNDFLHQILIDNWHPLHSYLLRRRAAETLHHLAAWNPTTRVAQDREYITLAALSGFHFRHVPTATVTYHRWSTQQITQSTQSTTRTQTLKTLYQRFQHHAQTQPHLQPHHHHLLQQSRHPWHLPPSQLTQQGDRYTLSQSTRAIDLTYPEAMILAALQKTSGSHSLEDHSRLILRHLWKTLLLRAPLTPNQIDQSLSAIVGLPPSAEAPPISTPGIALTPTLSLDLHPAQTLDSISPIDRIDAVPLFAPVFTPQRAQIQQTLEQFTQSGILQPVT